MFKKNTLQVLTATKIIRCELGPKLFSLSEKTYKGKILVQSTVAAKGSNVFCSSYFKTAYFDLPGNRTGTYIRGNTFLYKPHRHFP